MLVHKAEHYTQLIIKGEWAYTVHMQYVCEQGLVTI